MIRRHRGLTLLEMAVAFVIASVLFAITLPTWSSLNEGVNDNAARDRLLVARTEGRRIAALPQHHYQFPVDLAEVMDAAGIAFATGTSTGPGEISVDRRSATRVVYAIRSDDGHCAVLSDATDGADEAWGIDRDGSAASGCAASAYAFGAGSAARANPPEIDATTTTTAAPNAP